MIPMREPLLLDQTALATFEICPRRFQLRYLLHLPWPSSPLDQGQSQAFERGRQFHRLVERRFLGLPVEVEGISDDVVRDWWARFLRSGLTIPDGKRWPEHRLTIPIGNNFLTGRFDLLVLAEEYGRPFAQLFDWKTSRPRAVASLEAEWQTRLYLALLAESGQALTASGQSLSADRISLTYWYAGEPDQPRVVLYSTEKHRKNWSYIQGLVAAIEAFESEEIWPLTSDLSRCRACVYQTYCGRQDAGTAVPLPAEEAAPYLVEPAILFEPQSP